VAGDVTVKRLLWQPAAAWNRVQRKSEQQVAASVKSAATAAVAAAAA